MKIKFHGILQFIAFLLCGSAMAQQKILSLNEALQLAEKNNPAIEADNFKESADLHSVGTARSGYYPTLDFEAVDSTGFPASSQGTGVGGIMGSPYRSGSAYGLVAKETIWDFGRTSSSVNAAKDQVQFQKENRKVTAIKVKETVVNFYYDCLRFKSLRDTWRELANESQISAREIERFVKTGQRSIVEKYLVDAQSEEATTSQLTFEAQLSTATHHLALATGLNESEITCSDIAAQKIDAPVQNQGSSPFITRAAQGIKLAEAKVQRAKADNLPTLVAVGSYGEMEKVRFVEKKDYAVGIGLVFPLFEGFKTKHEVARAEAVVNQKEREFANAKLELEEVSTHYDQIINAAKIKMTRLEDEVVLAEKAYQLAKKRYFSLLGSLVDLRESLKNLTRTKTELIDAKTDFLQASANKALLNDGGF